MCQQDCTESMHSCAKFPIPGEWNIYGIIHNMVTALLEYLDLLAVFFYEQMLPVPILSIFAMQNRPSYRFQTTIFPKFHLFSILEFCSLLWPLQLDFLVLVHCLHLFSQAQKIPLFHKLACSK